MMGRPSVYSDQLADEMCEWLAEGNSLRTFCQQDGKPTYSTIMKWLIEKDDFSDKYRRARETQAHNDGDRMNEIIALVASGDLKPDQGRVMMDGLKWTAGKRLPRVYGDKLQLGGDENAGPISISWAGDKT